MASVRHRAHGSSLAGPTASVCIAIAVVLPVLYAVVSLVVLPSIYSDSGFGFLVWDSMRWGAPFNHLVTPDPADISRDVSEFFTYWTPGQYVFPGLIERLGLGLGRSIVLVDGVFSVAGIVGLLRLYRAFGFSRATAAISVAIVACSRHVALPFGYYNGGEVLMFGGGPWFLLLVWRLRRFPLASVPLLVIAGLLLIFLKLTGALVAGSAIGAAVLAKDGIWPVTRGTLRRAAVAGVALLCIVLLFYLGWYSRGATPGSMSSVLHWSKFAPNSAFAIVAIWGASFSLGDLASYLLLDPAHPALGSLEALGYAMLPFALASLLLVWRTLRHVLPEYLRFVFWMGFSFSAVLVVSWMSGGKVGEYEDRHYLTVSLVLLPALVESFTTARAVVLRAVFGLTMGVLSLYGISSFAMHAGQNLGFPVGVRGFRHNIASKAAVEFIHAVDSGARTPADTLIYVVSPEMALDVRRVRVMASHADFESPEKLAARTYHGRVAHLYLVMQRKLVDDGKADLILKSFVDYPAGRWRRTSLGSFVCFTPES
jgi:hypothetical protein